MKKSTRTFASGFHFGLAAAVIAALSLNARAAGPSVKSMLAISVDISRWLPSLSADLRSIVEGDGRLSGVQLSSLAGDVEYSMTEMRGRSISPDFNGEYLLSFGLDASFDEYTGGKIDLVFKVAPSAGGGCRKLRVTASKYRPGKRVYVMSPSSGEPLKNLAIRAYERNGRREIDRVVLEDTAGREETLNLASLPTGKCP